MKMIRVGFIGDVSRNWMGGLNYFKNLLYAIKKHKSDELEVFVFVGKKQDEDIKNMFRKYATVIEDSIFDKKNIKWIFHKIEKKYLKSNYILEHFLKNNNIDVLSHAKIVNLKSVKTINWIPDFQHFHLPEMFSKEILESRDKEYVNLIKYSDKVILSSYDVLNDYKKYATNYVNKAKVLQFVSQPNEEYFTFDNEDEKKLKEKYKIKYKFYYIPNQFWKHKNHMVVFEAVKSIINDGGNIHIVCSGHLDDYRNKTYIEQLKKFIQDNNLIENIKLLGLIDYKDVFLLIKYSEAVINPSLFEGWSSTVEECKSVSKNMILSDLNVHKEQYPEATFFEKNNMKSLKNILNDYKATDSNKVESLEVRTQMFANTFTEVVKELVD